MTKIHLLMPDIHRVIEIDLPEPDKEKSFRDNLTLREWFLKANIIQLKRLYWEDIRKANYRYSITVVFQSKMNKI